ncbi:MAG: hypothetical protein Q4F81_11360 [Eubacteriales bacterium]|nr:hypothetical protein [Eubacteriales bacterium]
MKDLPVFTTEHGAATLILKEIPYQETAYVILRDSLEPQALVRECADFCRACGAEKIYATGHDTLAVYPFYTAMWEMSCIREGIPDTDAALWPAQEKTLPQWQKIYNEKVKKVPNGAWMTNADAEKMMQTGDGYFIHRGETLLGIGRVSADRIDWVASVTPGAGADVVKALAHAATEDTIKLTVASVNQKAVQLYERLGFLQTAEISQWYQLR